jgi:hypothetical protein
MTTLIMGDEKRLDVIQRVYRSELKVCTPRWRSLLFTIGMPELYLECLSQISAQAYIMSAATMGLLPLSLLAPSQLVPLLVADRD